MARNIEDLFVRLKLEGFENLDKIKGSFRELNKVTGFTETEVSNLRKEVLEFGKAAGNTEAVTKGVISVLQGLRTQADLCGNAYAQLTNDLKRLNEAARGSTDTLEKQRQALLNNADAGRQNVDSLQRQINALKQLQRETRPGSSAFIQLGKDIDAVTVKLGKLKSEAQAFNLALNQQAGATPSVLNNQIALLQRGLQNVRYDAEQFVNTLRQLQLLQITQSGRTGRAGVIASFEAYQSREYLRGFADPSRLRAMPDTTAALNQELAELSDRLANTARGSSTYTDVAIRMAEVQRQLRTDVMGTSEAFRQLSIAEAGAERRAGKLASIQDYYSTQGPLAPGVGGYRDPATGAIIARGAYTPGRIRVEESAYPRPIGPQPFPEAASAAQRQVETALKDINAIYERAYVQRAELQSKYEQIHVDKLLEGLDLEGQVRQRAFTQELADFDKQLAARESRRRRRLTGMQLAQGVGAALSGGIFGGPEGLIGGAAGLAVGGVGGAFAGAAIGAQAGMLRQQLGAVTEYSARIDKLQIALRGIVGSQAAYSQALAAAASVTRDLNIPQETAIQGMTRLSAAVKGAGGTVSDSAFAFRAINEAVKATGGGAEQADGALLALTQVFSKGKVSAEELNQIAERLPGTFTLFAEAAGKSGPELQKALQEGKVGLNDLMKFLQLISSNYGQTALKIAKSSQEAGARLSVAMKNMQLEVGRALQPIGAQLQGAFTNFIVGITPATVAAANAVSMAIGGMYKGISAGFDLLVSMRGLFINLTKAMLVFGGATAGVFIATNIGTFTNALKGVLVVMRSILSIEKALLFVENARVAAQALLVGLTSGATKGKVAGLVLGAGAGVAAAVGLGKLTEQVTANIEKGLSGALKSVDTKLPQLTQFSTPTASASEGGGTGKSRESLARKLQQNFDSTIAQLGRQFNAAAKDKLYETVLQYEDQIQKAYKKNNITLAEELKLKQKAAALDITEEVLLLEKTALQAKLSEARSKGLEIQDVQNRLDNVNAELKQLQADRAKDYTAELEKQAQKAKELRDVMQQVFAPSSTSMGVFGALGSAQDYTFGEGDAFQTPGVANGTDRIKELKDELRSLTSPVTQVLTAAESIGSAFSASFSSIVTGASTARQSLATLFNSIAASFMDMATKIIAKWIEMAILNTVLKLLPGGSGFGVGSAQLDLPGLSGVGALSGAGASVGGFYDGVKLNAMGAAYAANGIQPFARGGAFSHGVTAYAMGGVVKRPTMFAFANGGAGRLGLMGEAGPEAIMPLRRLPSGRLGVESAGGGGMNVVVNVDASGSQVQGNSADASQLGKVLSAAVQQELINQQRPGGLLAPKR